MSKLTFDYVCTQLEGGMKRKDTPMRKAVSVKKRIAIALWYLGTNTDFRTIGYLFGVSKATVCQAIKTVCIVTVLLPHGTQWQ